MNSEHDHTQWLKDDTGEAAQIAYKYFMRPDPEQKEFVGERQEEYDVLTDSIAGFRLAKVGMTRGAKEENMKPVKVYVDFNGEPSLPHIRLDEAKPLQGWYQDKYNDVMGSRPRPCFTEAMLTEPYGGYCAVGCAFCYVNAGFRGYRGTGLISVPISYGDQVKRQLGKMLTSNAGYFSSFTDPFVSLEKHYHNTQGGAQAFVDAGLPIFFLSRLHYPDWAIDLMLKSPYSYAQKSLNTGDPETFKKLSPGALPLLDHIEEVRQMRKLGIYTSIQCNPIVPGVIDHDQIHELFHLLADAGNNHVIVKFVEAGFSWADTMVERIMKRFGPERGGRFKELFTENQAGAQRTINEQYRMEAHHKYRQWATELGMTYATCYEYSKNTTTKRWESVGKLFTTADQCHGHRVPMFTRPTTDVLFKEVVECAPTGCLYCGEDNGGKAKCGSALFGEAKALRAPDFKVPVRNDFKGFEGA